MDAVLDRLGRRIVFLEQKSKDDFMRCQNINAGLGNDLSLYESHLDYAEARISDIKARIEELKSLINETVMILKETASISYTEKISKRVDDLKFQDFLMRKEFEKMLK